MNNTLDEILYHDEHVDEIELAGTITTKMLCERQKKLEKLLILREYQLKKSENKNFIFIYYNTLKRMDLHDNAVLEAFRINNKLKTPLSLDEFKDVIRNIDSNVSVYGGYAGFYHIKDKRICELLSISDNENGLLHFNKSGIPASIYRDADRKLRNQLKKMERDQKFILEYLNRKSKDSGITIESIANQNQISKKTADRILKLYGCGVNKQDGKEKISDATKLDFEKRRMDIIRDIENQRDIKIQKYIKEHYEYEVYDVFKESAKKYAESFLSYFAFTLHFSLTLIEQYTEEEKEKALVDLAPYALKCLRGAPGNVDEQVYFIIKNSRTNHVKMIQNNHTIYPNKFWVFDSNLINEIISEAWEEIKDSKKIQILMKLKNFMLLTVHDDQEQEEFRIGSFGYYVKREFFFTTLASLDCKLLVNIVDEIYSDSEGKVPSFEDSQEEKAYYADRIWKYARRYNV